MTYSPWQTSATSRTFDLNIEKILEHWTPGHAIREFIANAMDEAVLSSTPTPKVYKDDNGVWHVRDFGRGLKYESLTQNENSEKLSRPDRIIGKFGVGMKDALATLDRHGIQTVLSSRHCRITTRVEHKHGFQEIATLHAIIDGPVSRSMEGTDIILRGVSDSAVQQAMRFFLAYAGVETLEGTQYGEILRRATGPARIYVNGLEVAQEENFLFSYNITSMTSTLRKALNRERTTLGRTAFAERVRAILLASHSDTVRTLLAEELAALETGRAHDEIQWQDVRVHATQILNAREKVIFVTAEELNQQRNLVDQAQRDGYEPVVVPKTTRDKISNARDISGAEVRHLDSYARDWSNTFEFQWIEPAQLSSSERAVWDHADAILRLIGGRPSAVRDIRISRNIRPASDGFQAAGLWEGDQGRIVICRDQLSGLAKFAGTLLHEATHAASGHSDVSRDFETSLTDYLGRAAAAALTARAPAPNVPAVPVPTFAPAPVSTARPTPAGQHEVIKDEDSDRDWAVDGDADAEVQERPREVPLDLSAAVPLAPLLARLPPGGTLQLNSGVYILKHGVPLRKHVTIRGAGMDATTIVVRPGDYGLHVGTEGKFGLHDLSMRYLNRCESRGLIIAEQGVIDITYCRFSGAYSADLTSGAGVRIGGDVRGTVKHCHCKGNRNGIVIGDQATPFVDNNVCEHNEGTGISHQGQSAGVARSNACRDNGNYGILVNDDAHPDLVGNTCRDSAKAGIAYYGDSYGTARRNTISGQSLIGDIYVSGNAKPTIDSNRYRHLRTAKNGRPVCINNKIREK